MRQTPGSGRGFPHVWTPNGRGTVIKLEIERREGLKWCVVADVAHVGPTPVLRWIKSKKAAQEAMERLYALPVGWGTSHDGRGWRLNRETGRILLDEQARILGV